MADLVERNAVREMLIKRILEAQCDTDPKTKKVSQIELALLAEILTVDLPKLRIYEFPHSDFRDK